MSKSAPKVKTLTARPTEFPALTKAQRSWIAARRRELKAAISDGIESGKKDGYRALDSERILAFIQQRQTDRSKRAKRG